MTKMCCMQCGWVGDPGELDDAMGYDEMCPYCGCFSEDISYYIPPKHIRFIKRLLYCLVTNFSRRHGKLYWKFNSRIKHIN